MNDYNRILNFFRNILIFSEKFLNFCKYIFFPIKPIPGGSKSSIFIEKKIFIEDCLRKKSQKPKK